MSIIHVKLIHAFKCWNSEILWQRIFSRLSEAVKNSFSWFLSMRCSHNVREDPMTRPPVIRRLHSNEVQMKFWFFSKTRNACIKGEKNKLPFFNYSRNGKLVFSYTCKFTKWLLYCIIQLESLTFFFVCCRQPVVFHV